MLDTLKTFIDVATLCSFTAVARRDGVAVSSVTRKIDALEEELGIKLLSRSSRAVLLTDAGEQFLPRARGIVAEMDDARQALTDMHADPRGPLSMTVPAAFGRRHIVPAIPAFLEKYPLIEIEMHVSDQQVDLQARRVDVAIRMGILPDSDLVATQLAPVRRLACASPAYLARHGRPETPEQLVAHNCLSYASLPLPAGWWTFPGVNRQAPLPVRGSLKTDDTEALLEAAVAGIGIVHLASWLVHEMIVAGRLVALFPPGATLPGRSESAIHAVRMPGRSHTKKAQLFIAHLKAHIGDTPYWDRT